MRLAVCILHYGKSDLTEKLHKQFLNADADSKDHIFVLDNNSPEPYVKAWKRLDTNLYWGGALQWAAEYFSADGYSHLWFCNNDITFVSQPPFYKRACGCIARLGKEGNVGMYSPSVTSNPYHKHMASLPGLGCVNVPYIDGIAPVIGLECLHSLGGLDLGENICGYGVDIWLSYRAAKAGWGVWLDHDLVVRHRYHATAKNIPGFLSRAGKAEEIYMRERLGPGWRADLEMMQKEQEVLE